MYKRIIICDDTIYSRSMLRNMIEEVNDYIIVEVNNRKELLETLIINKEKGREFDYLFLDLEIKRDDGLKILKKIREIEPLIEVILCGGVSLSDEIIAQGMNLGVKRFLPKPYKSKNVELILNNE
ncbi:response regulator [Bacillus mexicanus]|uniref:response regulator transcription factor n=1 Tax=Bacillus mexicanus TaxID=2834415 RepID=UPI003D213385